MTTSPRPIKWQIFVKRRSRTLTQRQQIPFTLSFECLASIHFRIWKFMRINLVCTTCLSSNTRFTRSLGAIPYRNFQSQSVPIRLEILLTQSAGHRRHSVEPAWKSMVEDYLIIIRRQEHNFNCVCASHRITSNQRIIDSQAKRKKEKIETSWNLSPLVNRQRAHRNGRIPTPASS